MAKQKIDAALRQQIAQWTRAALGPLVEDDGMMDANAPDEKSLNQHCKGQRNCCLNPTTYPGYDAHLHNGSVAVKPE